MSRIVRIPVPLWPVPLWLILVPVAHGASPPNASASDAGPSSGEVIVQGSRTLDEMRRKMIELEDRFYQRYNELNTLRDFDIHCAQETRAGTKLKQRFCRAVYESKAYEAEGRELAQFMQRITPPDPSPSAAMSADLPVVIGAPPVSAIVAIEARRPEFRKNMVEVTTQNPELVRLLEQRAELAKRYDAARRKLFRLKPPPEALPEEEGATESSPAALTP